MRFICSFVLDCCPCPLKTLDVIKWDETRMIYLLCISCMKMKMKMERLFFLFIFFSFFSINVNLFTFWGIVIEACLFANKIYCFE